MSTNHSVYANRLHRLADYLEYKVKPAVQAGRIKFDMQFWVDTILGAPREELDCGTSACAAGYATNIFPQLYLDRVRPYDQNSPFQIYLRNNKGEDLSSYDACFKFFGAGSDVFGPKANTYQNTIGAVVARLRNKAAMYNKTLPLIKKDRYGY